MKMHPECYSCLLRQGVQAVHLSGVDEETQVRAIQEVLGLLAAADPQLSPSAIAGETNQAIREVTGVDDFYLSEKQVSHSLAISYLDELRLLAGQEADPLLGALKVGAAGNIIDVIHVAGYDLWDEVVKTVNGELLGGGLPAFRERLHSASFILYLADNVGETVFDRVLIERLPLPVIYVVKGGPIFNDATRRYALAAGIDQVAEIIENGSRYPGTVLHQASEEFLDLFDQAELVISKGQANYETLDDQGDKVFFLMRVKCPMLSKKLDAPFGSLVLKQGNSAA